MTAPEVIALFGPTGVGKTDVAIALAGRLREAGESPVAVSADALQVYVGLETLTGAASAAERAQLEHRLLSFLPVNATFSAGFASMSYSSRMRSGTTHPGSFGFGPSAFRSHPPPNAHAA